MKKALFSFLTLFTSAGTLVCCALPATLVALGFGAAVAGLVTKVPGLIWLSEHKGWIFGIGGALLGAGGWLRWKAREQSCPTDPALAEACARSRDWSAPVYWLSVALYAVGAAFAYGPLLMSGNG